MAALWVLRRRQPDSFLQPDGRVLRTLQAPYHVAAEDGGYRISSAAFDVSKHDKACSVDLEQLLLADGLTATSLFPGLPKSVGLAAIPISVLSTNGLTVHHDPIFQNWYHGAVRGNFTQGVKKKLARGCVQIVPLDHQMIMEIERAHPVLRT